MSSSSPGSIYLKKPPKSDLDLVMDGLKEQKEKKKAQVEREAKLLPKIAMLPEMTFSCIPLMQEEYERKRERRYSK